MPLIAVVCGLEHSGTTITRALLDSPPRVFSPFELGLLLSEPHRFGHLRAPHTQPWAEWLMQGGAHSGCARGTGHRIRQCTDHAQAYAVYEQARGAKQRGAHLGVPIAQSDYFVDKTPAYIYQLPHVFARMRRARLRAPVFIPLKDSDDLVRSYARRGILSSLTARVSRATKSLAWLVTHRPSHAFAFALRTHHEEESAVAIITPVMRAYAAHVYAPNEEPCEVSLAAYHAKVTHTSLCLPYQHYRHCVMHTHVHVPSALRQLLREYRAVSARAIALGVENMQMLCADDRALGEAATATGDDAACAEEENEFAATS